VYRIKKLKKRPKSKGLDSHRERKRRRKISEAENLSNRKRKIYSPSFSLLAKKTCDTAILTESTVNPVPRKWLT
jgi:hypothetical protein